ncbi:MAG: MFS transporter [Candidatus Solibacter sp.]
MSLTSDAWRLFATRFARLFAYGALSVVLVFYLTGLGLTESQTGLLFTLILAGDTVISLFLTNVADRWGRRRVLIAGAILMAGAGLAFALTSNFLFLLLAGTIGVISPSGNEVGPFLSIEQAVLAHVIPAKSRTAVFAWHSLIGSFATALGSLAGGLIPGIGQTATHPNYRAVVVLYACGGLLLAAIFASLSPASEVHDAAAPKGVLGIGHSRAVVFKLAALMGLDAFGGGFVVQSLAAYWFYLKFGVQPATLGGIFFGANLFAGISALLASRLAARFGLVNTMVFTHLPSNILLILVPLMPTLPLAITVLLLRFSISQMDVPTRQSYLMAVVRPEERSAAAGITGVARTIGASLAPWIAGILFTNPNLLSVPFYLAGALKIAYDLILYRQFINLPPEEK